jgi:hypothetical protein
MSNTEYKNYFTNIKKNLIAQYNNKPLTNTQITKIMKYHIPSYKGTFAQNTATTTTGMKIVNTDTRNKNGTHWIGVYINLPNIYVYDSFASHTSKTLPIFYKKCKKKNLNVIDVNRVADQYQKSSVCGYASISYLLTIHKFGIKSGFDI